MTDRERKLDAIALCCQAFLQCVFGAAMMGGWLWAALFLSPWAWAGGLWVIPFNIATAATAADIFFYARKTLQ